DWRSILGEVYRNVAHRQILARRAIRAAVRGRTILTQEKRSTMDQAASEASGALPEGSPPGRAVFAFIFITVLLDMLALGIIIPVLPTLVVGFMGGDTAGGAEVLGLFGTAWALMQFLFSPVLGALSDRFGRRPVILISCLGLALDYILMALAP